MTSIIIYFNSQMSYVVKIRWFHCEFYIFAGAEVYQLDLIFFSEEYTWFSIILFTL